VFTQCSNCETVFKLSAEVLRAAGGQVRCGKCGEVFNALAHLAEDPSAFTTTETELDLEVRADNILGTPAPPIQRRAAPESGDDADAPPGVEIARLQILDWNEGETPPSAPSAASARTEDAEDEVVGETSMEFTLPPGELDRIFVETKKGALPKVPAQQPGEEIEVFNAAENAEPHSPIAPSAPGEVSEAVRREMLSGFEQPNDSYADDAHADDARPDDPQPVLRKRRSRRVPRRASPFDLAPPEPSGARVKWLGAAIGAAALLIVQVIHHNREWLAAHTPLGAPLRAIYSTVGTPVTPPANLTAYQLRQWGVTGDPAGAGSLRVRASILNTAAQLEPYPLLRVTLANRFGGSIGTRDFEPSEYLGKPTAKLLAPGERVDATLDILDPGKSAEGFEIDVCLRSADRRVACANDKAPAQAKR
jgi:predicted Zn finger-like uncharacterized protein